MNPLDPWHWFSGDTGLMAVFAQNRLVGACLIAAIIFVETGLVVMPFLPGDALLFGAGAYLGVSGHSPLPVIFLAVAAAVAGDAVNFSVGRSRVGQSLVRRGSAKAQHLDRARSYFERYGGMTITIARFVPIIRTVAPFVAGLSEIQLAPDAIDSRVGGHRGDCGWPRVEAILGFDSFPVTTLSLHGTAGTSLCSRGIRCAIGSYRAARSPQWGFLGRNCPSVTLRHPQFNPGYS